MKKPTLLLDRDGVINPLLETSEGKVSPQNVDEFEFLPGAEKAIQKAVESGFRVIVFTNQPDVGKEWRELDEDRLEEMNEVLRQAGVEAVYSCIHGPLGGREDKHYMENGEIVVCDCRKPQSGLIERALEDYEIDFENSYVVGDNETDLEAAEKYEEKHEESFAGKYRIGEKTGVGDRTFDNICSTIHFIAGDKV